MPKSKKEPQPYEIEAIDHECTVFSVTGPEVEGAKMGAVVIGLSKPAIRALLKGKKLQVDTYQPIKDLMVQNTSGFTVITAMDGTTQAERTSWLQGFAENEAKLMIDAAKEYEAMVMGEAADDESEQPIH